MAELGPDGELPGQDEIGAIRRFVDGREVISDLDSKKLAQALADSEDPHLWILRARDWAAQLDVGRDVESSPVLARFMAGVAEFVRTSQEFLGVSRNIIPVQAMAVISEMFPEYQRSNVLARGAIALADVDLTGAAEEILMNCKDREYPDLDSGDQHQVWLAVSASHARCDDVPGALDALASAYETSHGFESSDLPALNRCLGEIALHLLDIALKPD